MDNIKIQEICNLFQRVAALVLYMNLSGGHLEIVAYEPVGKKIETIIEMHTFKSVVNLVSRRLSSY